MHFLSNGHPVLIHLCMCLFCLSVYMSVYVIYMYIVMEEKFFSFDFEGICYLKDQCYCW